MRKIFLIFLALSVSVSSFAQKTKKERKEEKRQRINALMKQEEEGVIAYHKHTVYGAKLTNDGYGKFLEIGRAQSVKKALLFQLDISERKHPKEEKVSNSLVPTTPFVYGKINYLYPVKLGVQKQLLFGNKSNKNGVSVTGNFGGGISMGLLRPYFLEVNDNVLGGRKLIRYESADKKLFTDVIQLNNLFVGGAGFGKGWSNLSVVPGLYAKTALRFDYGRYNEMVNGLEVGLTGEFYTKGVEQMVSNKAKQFFLNVYIAIIFGRRK